ncbi:TetR/AcrR family transcriptional regulator [Baekduia sp.]|uniref:TetR/AcrR family transcriptional regulator n=1 Tax=Baekduia sp. TaxID=2600305 RepID=UPI002E046064|nr:TetR/AcrR family transcriptional regulator [Baekduia sp.]
MASARQEPSARPLRGPRTLDAGALAGHQRRRLHQAAALLFTDRGYSATTVQDLATEAGVSTGTFYILFAGGKPELALEACDAGMQAACESLRARPIDAGELQDRLAAVLTAVVEIILADAAAARLALVDVAAVGQRGLLRRQSLTIGLHDLLRQAATVNGSPVLSETALTVLAGGTLRIFDGHLRAGRLRPLRPAALDLAAWGALYESAAPRRLPAPNPLLMASQPEAPRQPPHPLPRGRHGLPPGFVRRNQRTRILEAVLAVAAQPGFEAASIRELFAAAGLSPEAFYEHFSSKEDAWETAFDQAFVALFGAAWHAALPHRDRPAKVSAAVGAALALLAAEPGYARLLLVDAPSAGRAGQPAIDDALQAFSRLLTRATAGPAEQPKLLPVAMAAGIAELVGGWVLDGRTAQLPALQAPLVELILTPALGLRAASRAADAASRAVPAGTGIDDRRRLMDAVAETAQRDGLDAAGLSDVAQRAGVELDVAHTLFTDELDVAVQALDAWAGQLVVVAAGAFLGAAGDPPLAAHQALQAAVSHIARTPALAALAVSDDPALAQAVSGLRERYIALFFSLIAGQVPATEQRAPQPFAALEVVLDGILAVLRRFAREERVPELTAELPTLSRQVLTPFFGADEAQRIAELSAAASPPR